MFRYWEFSSFTDYRAKSKQENFINILILITDWTNFLNIKNAQMNGIHRFKKYTSLMIHMCFFIH